MDEARRDRRRRRWWTLGACTLLLLGALWVAGDVIAPVFGEAWIADLELALQERGCPSSLGSVISLRPWSGLALGPVALCSRGNGLALFRADRLEVTPYWKSLWKGKPALRSIVATQVLLDGDRLWELGQRAATQEKGSAGGGLTADGVHVRLNGVRVLVRGHVLGGAEVVLDVTRRSGSGAGSAAGSAAEGGEARLMSGFDRVLDARWQRTGGEMTAQVELALAPVASWTEALWLRSGVLHATLRPAAGSGRAAGSAQLSLALEDLRIQGAPLSDGPVGPWAYGLDTDLAWNAEGVQASSLTLSAGPDKLRLAQGSARLPWASDKDGSLSLDLSDARFSAWVGALPLELQPPPEVPRLDGPLVGTLRITGPLGRPEAWDVRLGVGLDGLRRSARRATWAIRGPFLHTPRIGAKTDSRQIAVGPDNPLFVPLADLPQYVVRSVTLAEDAGFFSHAGFDFDELRKSLLDPVERQRHRGASTLTQQLAKNLFSAGERTYARKVREALATLTLEAALPKARILELYLNLIEWGPDVYGIGEAAQHYFGVDARTLTPKQAVFLATLIPNPVRYHVQFARGALSDTWEERVNELLTKLRETGVLTPEAFEQARASPLVFRPQGTPVRTTW